MEQPNRVELAGIKLLLARLKSKSPQNYTRVANICGVAVTIMGLYVIAYNQLYTPTFPHWAGVIDNYCIGIGFLLGGLGFGAKTTTADPALLNPSVKAAVIAEAINNGTHKEVKPDDTAERGNDTNG